MRFVSFLLATGTDRGTDSYNDDVKSGWERCARALQQTDMNERWLTIVVEEG
jgi:hypothetical protein